MNRSFSRCSIRRRCVALGGPAPGRACGDGFTLIELLVVIGIIAIVAAIAILSMTTTTRGAAVQAEAERLVAALRQARALAVQTGSVYGIAFNMHEYRPGETDVTDAAQYVKNVDDNDWMSRGDRLVDGGSGDPPDYIPTNHTGSHWYQMFGPAPRPVSYTHL
ncbi:MAG: prepilin-type N-terminal cleavage/methylation domain-containing protein, partial [Rectinema sp.]|nr:prepilin-type N-terminal cleavage/methylation domain-containing protein [Rectinema sp.]